MALQMMPRVYLKGNRSHRSNWYLSLVLDEVENVLLEMYVEAIPLCLGLDITRYQRVVTRTIPLMATSNLEPGGACRSSLELPS